MQVRSHWLVLAFSFTGPIQTVESAVKKGGNEPSRLCGSFCPVASLRPWELIKYNSLHRLWLMSGGFLGFVWDRSVSKVPVAGSEDKWHTQYCMAFTL